MAGSKRFEIDMLLNSAGVERGAKDASKAISQLADEIEDAGAGGARDVDKLEDALKDTARQAKRTEDAVGDVGERGFRKLGDKGAEVSGELRQNLGETFSSFRGDLEDLPQIAQDTLGGLAGSGALGGIPGLAATAAGAAGLGLIIGAMDVIDERNEALQQRANDLAKAFMDAGTNVMNATAVAAASADVLTDNDKRKEVQAYADALGVDLATAVRAYVGDANAMAVVDKIAADAKAENLAIADKQKGSTKALTDAQLETIKANQAALGAQRELNGVLDEANAKFQTQQAVLQGLINDAQGATKEVDELGNAVYTLPDGTQILVEAKTGQATTDISKFKGDVDGIPEVVTSTVRFDVDDSAVRRWTAPTKFGAVQYRAGNQLGWE